MGRRSEGFPTQVSCTVQVQTVCSQSRLAAGQGLPAEITRLDCKSDDPTSSRQRKVHRRLARIPVAIQGDIPLETDYATGCLLVDECSDFLRGPRATGSSREDDYQLKFIRVDGSSSFGVVGGGDEGHDRGKTPRPDTLFLPDHVLDLSDMGLLTIIRKNRRKEKEMRVLFLHVVPLCGRNFYHGFDAAWTGASITLGRLPFSRSSTTKISRPSVRPWVSISRPLCTGSMLCACPKYKIDVVSQIHIEHMFVASSF